MGGGLEMSEYTKDDQEIGWKGSSQLCGLGAIQNPHTQPTVGRIEFQPLATTDRQGFNRPSLPSSISHPLRQIKDLQTHVDLLIKSNQELIESLEYERVKYDAYRILRSAVAYLRKSRPHSVWDSGIEQLRDAAAKLKTEYLHETVVGVSILLERYKDVTYS
jgi:hypothetical protein